MMNYFKNIAIVLGLGLIVSSCFNENSRNYQYFPDMYEPVGYETYQASDAFPLGYEAMLPPANTIKRGWMPYEYENTPEGRELAYVMESPLDSLSLEEDLANGKELYDIYCAICHGTKGNGQGKLAEREKILGVPSYETRDITAGTTYHVIYHGLNSMGSYKNQLNEEERWQVSLHVMQLREKLVK